MKRLFNYFVVLLLIFHLFSCNEEDEVKANVDESVLLANEQNAKEERVIPLDELSKKISFKGGVKKLGGVPPSNGNIEVNTPNSTQSAFLKSGFEIEFTSNISSFDIAGAYVQLLDSDGNKMDGYYDVPSSSFSFGRTKATGDMGIRVEFANDFEPGTFCYEIYLYGTDNFVSLRKKVCVEVEAWGGNSDLVGTWLLDSLNGLDFICPAIFCDNDTIYVCDEIDTTQISFTFNSDGIYEDLQTTIFRSVDTEMSKELCKTVYQQQVKREYRATGNWAYNEIDKELTVIASVSPSFKPPYFEHFPADPFLSDFLDYNVHIDKAILEVIDNKMRISVILYEVNGEPVYGTYLFSKQ